MVLWEITAATAYFLGLKRTYKLALRIQRRLVGPNHPKIRSFLHRRTRTIFDMAIRVHRNIQERDIEVGRNLGNWILRWLDRMKPSAEIRPRPPPSCSNLPKYTTTSHRPNTKQMTDKESNNRHLFTPLNNLRTKSFPTISMMLHSRKPVGMNSQYRHLSYTAAPNTPSPDFSRKPVGMNTQNRHLSYTVAPSTPSPDFGKGHFQSVFRRDIAQLMLNN